MPHRDGFQKSSQDVVKGESAVGIAEAKAHFSEIIDRVAKGEEIAVMRHGRLVARIVPERPKRKRVLGSLKGRVKLLPGWDKPLTYEDLFGE